MNRPTQQSYWVSHLSGWRQSGLTEKKGTLPNTVALMNLPTWKPLPRAKL
ncbi:MAG: hypothetical protein V4623_10935 [Pseudomonadota bacterium]